jgi:hypothetical protein
VYLIELLPEQISGLRDQGFDLNLECRCIGCCLSSWHIAASTELCNSGVNAMKFGRFDPPFTELVFRSNNLAVFDCPQNRDLFRPVAFAAVASV